MHSIQSVLVCFNSHKLPSEAIASMKPGFGVATMYFERELLLTAEEPSLPGYVGFWEATTKALSTGDVITRGRSPSLAGSPTNTTSGLES